MRTLNSYNTQVALQNAINNKTGKCICVKNGKLEGMTLTIDEVLDYSIWRNPDNNKNEYLLLLEDIPLVSISKLSFEKHFNVI
jgi:hypothetical protein